MQNPLLDKHFLKKLDMVRNVSIYVRITALDLNDFPVERIEGLVTQGSVNVDGSSAVRRSCSLTFTTKEQKITDVFWSLKSKFKLEVGKENTIDSNYPDIIWFDQGVYLISSFSKSTTTSNITISINGKDKMSKLNGEMGGNLPSQVDFGVLEELDIHGNTVLTKLPIYQIIQQAVKEYGQERAENIIINDLDEYGYELWEYRGKEPMYLIIEKNGTDLNVINITFNGDTVLTDINIALKDIEKEGYKYYSMNTLDKNYNNGASTFNFANKECYIAKIEYGETAGYHRIDLIYNSDLILNAGDTVTSLLDKLKNMLGEFEYFYDLQGRFVFQRKNTYIQELFSPLNGELVEPTALISPYAYRFDNQDITTNTSEAPKITDIKNDFSIWGTRKSASGAEIAIHARYALDTKPKFYISPYERYKAVSDLYFLLATKVELKKKEDEEVSNDIDKEKTTWLNFVKSIYSTKNIYKLENNKYISITYEDYEKEQKEKWKDIEVIETNIIPIYTLQLKKYLEEEDYQVEKNEQQEVYIKYTNFKLYQQNLKGEYEPFDLKYQENNKSDTYYIKNANNSYELLSKPSEEKIENARWLLTKFDTNDEGEEEKISTLILPQTIQLYIEDVESPGEYILYSKLNFTSEEECYIYEEGYKNQEGRITDYRPVKIESIIASFQPELNDVYNQYIYTRIPDNIKYVNQDINEFANNTNKYDWREILYQIATDYYNHNQEVDYLIKLENANPQFVNGKTGYEQYYSDLLGFWRQLYNPTPSYSDYEQFGEFYTDGDNKYWNKIIHTDPNSINFWFDFLDVGKAKLSEYSVSSIGHRPKVDNNSSVKSIYYKETPEILFIIAPIEKASDLKDLSYMPIWIQDNMQSLFTRSSQGLAAISRANELIYQHACCADGLSFTSLPIYYLEPNTRIYIEGQGDYILSKISFSLTHNATMQLSGTKIIQQFY